MVMYNPDMRPIEADTRMTFIHMINSTGSALKGPVQTPLQSCAEPVMTDKN